MIPGSVLWHTSGATGVVCFVLLSLESVLGMMVNHRVGSRDCPVLP
jgi:hypothetical protein